MSSTDIHCPAASLSCDRLVACFCINQLDQARLHKCQKRKESVWAQWKLQPPFTTQCVNWFHLIDLGDRAMNIPVHKTAKVPGLSAPNSMMFTSSENCQKQSLVCLAKHFTKTQSFDNLNPSCLCYPTTDQILDLVSESCTSCNNLLSAVVQDMNVVFHTVK